MFTAFAVGLGLTVNVMAQVPSYVPTNGLVGWWPFNGNANDESGNGNNGTVNGATLTTDRFGNEGKAYSFDGVNDYLEVQHNNNLNVLPITILAWFQTESPQMNKMLVTKYACQSQNGYSLHLSYNSPSAYYFFDGNTNDYLSLDGFSNNFQNLNDNFWHCAILMVENDSSKLFIDGVQIYNNSVVGNLNVTSTNVNLYFGRYLNGICGLTGQNYYYNGKIDEIGIWNRTLSDCEIQDLYNAQFNSVAGLVNVSQQPALISSNVSLSTNTNSTNVQWQSNPSNYGWQNVPTNSTYNGGTTNTLTVSNVQLANHNQPFRVIASNGNCTDTSNIATIQIADTCITTVFDTLLTTVTDTLIINTSLGLPAPNNENTILVYPNPANDHITIDNGNFAAMAGYSIKIENNAGQQVFQSAINQVQFYVDLSTWTGNGLYFVHLIDPQNNTVTVRKIVLQ